MNLIIKLFFATAFGVMFSMIGAKYTAEGNLPLIWGWMILGCIVAYLVVGPKEAWQLLKRGFDDMCHTMRHNSMERKAEKEKNQLAKQTVRRLFVLTRQWSWNSFLSTLFATIWTLLFLMPILNPETDAKPWAVVIGLTASVVIGLIIYADRYVYLSDTVKKKQGHALKDVDRIKVLKSFEKKYLKELRMNIRAGKKRLSKFALGPIWLVYKYSKPFVISILILASRLFTPLAESKILGVRCCAGVGSIVGFAIGWTNGQDLILGMTAGGLVGVIAFGFVLAVSRILPDPSTVLPLFKEA